MKSRKNVTRSQPPEDTATYESGLFAAAEAPPQGGAGEGRVAAAPDSPAAKPARKRGTAKVAVENPEKLAKPGAKKSRSRAKPNRFPEAGEPLTPEIRDAILRYLPTVPELQELLNFQRDVPFGHPDEGRGDDGPALEPEPKKPKRTPKILNPDDPATEEVDPAKAKDYVIQTSQEVDALMRAASDGRSGDNWRSDQQSMRRFHELPGSSHRIELSLSEDERAAGVPLQALEALSFDQDPDFNFAMLYISRLLAPPAPLPSNLRAANWIDLDDVMEKIGWDPRSRVERLEMRNRVWRYILFGARAAIVGQRSGEYIDRKTGERIETVIDSPAWAVLERERPAQPSLYPEMGEAPVRVELIASRNWTRLTTQPETAQYLPMGELLGAIPGNRPSGAWARVVGLSLANFWRRHPRAALDGSLQPTRRELLERFKPATGSVQDILNGNDPKRAVSYWHSALQILVENGFLAPEGEADAHSRAAKPKRPRKDWQEDWLNESVDLRPGPQMLGAVGNIGASLPPNRRRELRAPGKKGYKKSTS